ncbi:Helicase POLQ-like protein [Trachymyrmex septentrionalis]|uniref:Helicase POLQ-like protein n=1 Tax=Trachymyrmex septentrionalis TaxID=34720 RepID=A0A195FNH9_9HYME|nr:Helicase POLQ-like protein [Trachymyrmex septentrionalis]
MQSFGDDTLLACINVEKKHQILQKQTEGKIQELQEENVSDLGKYFKSNSLLSEFANTQNNVDKLKSSDSETKKIEEKKMSVKYFEDSILFPEANSRRNLSPAFSAQKGNSLPSQKKRSPHRTNNKNVDTNLKEKHRLDITNSTKKCEKFSTQGLYKNKSSNNIQNAISSSDVIRLSAVNSTYNEENSEFVISSPPIGTQDRCKLASWGLPPYILQKYIARGVEEMFTWQMECLSNHLVMQESKNLVYSAPTSAGKTFVAEMLLIKTVLEKKKKVIFILPFVSVVREKMYYFQDLLSDIGIKVHGFMGGSVPPGGFATTDVAVATIEKANSLVNRLMEENDLSSLGAVIIDELHLLGDPNRGYLLELLLTKLKYMTIHNNDVNIQLIGMSATLPNLTLLAKWLNAELYKTEFRPIPLNEYCKIGANIYDNKLTLVRKLIESQELGTDVDNILQLCIETISAGHSVLIFCPTKKWCEKLAEQIATAFFKLGCGDTKFGEMLKKEIDSTLIQETLEQLKRSPSGLDNILKNTISFGTAFHHAGLTMDERDIIEGSFRTGSLRVLIATSTLSSGVNLPARRVIIRSPLFGGSPLNTLTYKQMIGRAGRMGKDSAGESILICKPNERNAAASLLSAALDPIESCLNDSTLLIRALLEAVASEVLYTYTDLQLYINCTLLSLNEQSDVQTFSNEAIKFLLDNEFLLLQTTERESRWVATPLGKACLAASIPPREGLFLFEELQKARRCFVLDTELHVIYLVTPLSSGCQIGTVDWMTFHELWNIMSESERRVGKLVGVEERFVLSAVRGIVKSGKSLSIHRRFYSALALHDLVKEVPLHAVCKKYGCCRGVLQTLQQSAATYAGMVTQFCKQLGWDCMELLVSQFQTRLQFGVCRELLDLLRLPMLNGLRARSLYKQGIETVADLAIANELNVERALYNALPFESEKECEGEYAFDVEKRNKMRTVFVTGRDGLTPQQAAILLVQEARMLIQNELGLEQMPWEQNEQSLQVNTCVKNIEDTSDIKEKIQSLDVKNSPKMRTSIIENSLHVKSPMSNENQKENNPKLDIRKENETNVSNTGNVQLCDKNNVKSIGTANLQSKNSILSWGDDSWINCEGLLKQIAQDQNVIQSKKDISNSKIKNIVNTNISLALKNTKTCTQSNKESTIKMDIKKRTAALKEKAPRKSKLSRKAEIDSPVANIIVFKKERKTSADSNKSDSDDFIVGSQHFESPFSSNKSRTKTTLEKIRKLRSQKLAQEDTLTEMNNCLINSPIKETSNDKVDKIKEEEREMTSKLKEIPAQNPSASIDSVIYNSEDEIANNLTRSTLKTKQYEIQSNNLDKNVKLKIENVLPDKKKNLLNETIEWNTLNIVKVANNRATFNLFKREILKKRNIALALHCDLHIDDTTNIGSKICASNAEGKRKSRRSGNYSHGNKEIRGVAISWESNIAYYISFSNSQESKVSGKEQMALLKDLLYDTTLYMKCFAIKDIYKLLYQCCGITAKCRFLDPVIGHWLYTNDSERNFNEMVLQYFQQGNVIMKRIKSCYCSGPGMDVQNSLPGEFRSAAEAVLTWHMMDNIMNKLEELNPTLLYTFREVEMRIMTTLACMELSGIGVNLKSLQELSSVVSNEMQSLETKAYNLAGRKFNFSSSKEVGQVLGLYKDKKVSTSKTVLEKCDNPISTLVISWRKLNATRTKMIYPLLNLAQGDSRVRGNCITCTVTGRVSMHEPNLQNVPKDFSFADNNLVVSVRMAFVPALGNIMLSADYCQLELRLLTHFSQDSVLCKIMKQPGDIFKNIAAKWNNVAEEQVTSEMRQRTKQLCYGMIYGMGVKSLAENLCISEPEAQEFLESFMSAYPGIYKWLNDVLEEAHHDGYVTTLLGRRRQLPDLSNTKSSVRAQAERQSVNTKVQGSAADIVKKAMISIEDKIRCYFPDSAIIFPEVHTTRKLRSNLQQRGGYLVLQLHDELLYEINLADLKKVAVIIRESMENVCQLTVPLPIKIRVGPAWGDLNDYQF